jgi:hypothetical protein
MDNIDLASFSKWFPKQMPVPPLLLEFGKWLEDIDYGQVGYFDTFRSGPLDWFHEEKLRATMSQSLGLVLDLDGEVLALWNYGGPEPAVVYLGDGERLNVATDFGSFLWALAEARTGVNTLDDEEASGSREALAAWLRSRDVRDNEATVPSFRDWFRVTVAKVEKS